MLYVILAPLNPPRLNSSKLNNINEFPYYLKLSRWYNYLTKEAWYVNSYGRRSRVRLIDTLPLDIAIKLC